MERLLEATARAEQRHFWFRGLRRFVRPLLVRATEDYPHPDILDCGCGTGTNYTSCAKLKCITSRFQFNFMYCLAISGFCGWLLASIVCGR